MSSKIFCDVGEIPKGKKRGSMVECAEKGQIKYYGEKKVDKKIIESMAKRKTGSKRGNAEAQIENIKIKLAGISGKIKAITRKIDNEDDKKTIKQLEKDKKSLEKTFGELKQKAISLKNLCQLKRTPKKSSRRSSRRS